MTVRGSGPEGRRRRALARYAVLDTPEDPAFDDLAELARTLTGAAASGIGLVDGERIWFKAARGIGVRECVGSALPACPGPEPAVVGERVVLGDAVFSTWAGAPLTTSEGYVLGQLFVLDPVVDPVTADLAPERRHALGALARQVQVSLELRRTLFSYHAVVDGVGHVVFQVDEAERLVSVTPTWSRLTGFGVVRSLGRPLTEFVHVDDRDEVTRRLAGLAGTGASRATAAFECRLLRLAGGDVPVEVIARPMVDESGRLRGLVGVIADISDRRAREVEVQHAQKLEALGRLSAGLAHEINTPIQFVGDNTRFLADAYRAFVRLAEVSREIQGRQGTPDLPIRCRDCHLALDRAESEADLDFLGEEIPAAIEQSLEGLNRVRTLVRAMRTFSHPGEDNQAPADLHEALTSAVTVARSQVAKVADIVCDFADLPPVICSIGDLNQVFLNLLLNAADAIAESGRRGTLTIATRLDGDQALVCFSDTGVGIPEDLRLRIFEPFFTTKRVGSGTGQGLAMARAVVHDKHGGRITVASAVGEGSTFTIALPVGGRSPRPEPEPGPGPEGPPPPP